MRFFPNGPMLPSHLLEQRNLGNVIFFCGAGISIPAGLPDFPGLTNKIVTKLAAERGRDALVAGESLDRVFNALVREFGRPEIDRQIYAALRTPRKPNLALHKIILNLSRGPSGNPQVVTTNFDLLFESCERGIKRYVPPALPDLNLGQAIEGVVYLHGRLTASERTTSAGYIISSADFGRAYLADGWAANFVRLLRENYTIVLLGYRAEDPPIRYLLEGLNDRSETAYRSPIYAFTAGSEGDAEEEWFDKGVTPICYEASDDHAALWDTLAAWASAVADTEKWHADVIKLAQSKPTDLLPFERGQVAQLVSTKGGAKLFADADPKPPAEWMSVFDAFVRYGEPKHKSWDGDEKIDPLDLLGLDDDPPRPAPDPTGQRKIPGIRLIDWRSDDATFPEATSLVDWNPGRANQLPERLFHLARWFASVMDQPAAVWWTAGWRSLNANFLEQLNSRFTARDDSFPEAASHFWDLFLEEQTNYIARAHDFSWFELRDAINKNGWTKVNMRAFERALRPRLDTGRPSLYTSPCPPSGTWPDLPLRNVVDFKVRALDRHGEEIDIPDARLAEVVSLVRRSLQQSSDLLAEIGTLWWSTPTFHPTGERGESFPGRKEKHLLWFKELFLRLMAVSPPLAVFEMAQWSYGDRYFLGKMRIFALMFAQIASGADVAEQLLRLDSGIFWDPYCQRELLFTLRERWADLNQKDKRAIERQIIRGAVRYEGQTKKAHRLRRATDAASRLRWLEMNGCALTPITARKLETLKTVDPRWSDDWAANVDDSLGPRGGFVETITEPQGLDHLPINEIVKIALEKTENRHGELRNYRPFAGLVKAKPLRALSALRLALKQGNFIEHFWRSLISEWPENASARLRRLLAYSLARLPDEDALKLRYDIPRWLCDHIESLAQTSRKDALAIYDGIARPYFAADASLTTSSIGTTTVGGIPQARSEFSTGKALNSSVGNLTRSLWALLPNKVAKKRSMPAAIGNRLKALLAVPGDGAGHAASTLAQRMGWLNFCYPAWTSEVMVPLFRLENPLSEAVWHGLARDDNGLPHDTLRALNEAHLQLLAGCASWSLDESELKHHIDRLVSLTRSFDGKPPIISFSEARKVLTSLDDKGRAHAVWTLARWVEKAGEWRKFVKPFIETAWPLQLRFRTDEVTRSFVHLIESAGRDFPEVVRTVLKFLRPLPNLDMITYRMAKATGGEDDLATLYPAEALLLLDAVIAEDRSQMPYELGKTLDKIVEAAPQLRRTQAWRRLKELAQ